jgi:hypothetical protein
LNSKEEARTTDPGVMNDQRVGSPEQNVGTSKDSMLSIEKSCVDEMSAMEDSEQARKWLEFIQGDMDQLKSAGVDLLRAMEQSDGENKMSETEEMEMMELTSEMSVP